MSQALENQVSANHSDEALFFLMTIQSPELSEDLHVVNNNEAVVSRGVTYEAFPFVIELPPDDGGAPKDLRLKTYNVSEEFMDLIRQTTEPPKVKLELVSSRDMDFVEKTIGFMALGGAEYDASEISFTLISNQFSARNTLKNKYAQNEFPGLFFALQ